MALTSAQRKVLEENLDTLNAVIDGPRLTVADFHEIDGGVYGDVRFNDTKRAQQIRDSLVGRHVPGSERKAIEELVGILDMYFPTKEAEEKQALERREHDIGIENTKRRFTGEPLLVLPSEGGDGKKAIDPEVERAKNLQKPSKKGIHRPNDDPSRKATLKAEGYSPLGDDPNRRDVADKYETVDPPATSEEAAYNHTYGVLTPAKHPTEQILSPESYEPEQVLTPKDVVQEDIRLNQAKAVAVAEEEVDRIEKHNRTLEETRRRGRDEQGIEVDKKAAAHADKQSDERLAEAKRKVAELRKDADRIVKESLDATDPITTMKDRGRVPGESPTIGDLEVQGTEKDKAKSTAETKPVKAADKGKVIADAAEHPYDDEVPDPDEPLIQKAARRAKQAKAAKPAKAHRPRPIPDAKKKAAAKKTAKTAFPEGTGQKPTSKAVPKKTAAKKPTPTGRKRARA